MKMQSSFWMVTSLTHRFLLVLAVCLLASCTTLLFLVLQTYYQKDLRQVLISTYPDLMKRPGFHTYPNLKVSHQDQFWINPQTFLSEQKVLLTVNHINSNPACPDCHHWMSNHLQEILLVNGQILQHNLFKNGLTIIGFSTLLILFILFILYWFVQKQLLFPLKQLLQIVQSASTLPASARDTSPNELMTLSTYIHQLSDQLQTSVCLGQEQKKFFQSLIDAIPDGIRIIDQNYRIVAANHAYHQQLGLGKNTFEQTPLCHLSSYARQTPCPPTLMTCPLHEIKHPGHSIKLLTEHVRADGSKLQVEIGAAMMEVNLHKQQQKFIVESVRDLSQTIQFSHEQKLASLGQLAAGVAHDINNPLSSIRLALQASLRILTHSTPNLSQITDYLLLVDKQIDKCILVTQRLLKLAAPSTEQRQLISLNEVILDTIALLAFESKEQNISIGANFNDQLHRILAVETDIRMLIFNLLQNALNAMPQGGEVNITARTKEDIIQLSVKDTGTGIHPSILNNIFEPFFSHRTQGKKGSGLGLAICKSIIERYHGRIEVLQTHAPGCEFLITLPNANNP